MSLVVTLLAGLFVAVGAYLALSRSTMRMLTGVAVLTNGAILTVLAAGRPGEDGADPLAQMLAFSAIVIGFAVFCVLLTLAYRAGRDAEADDGRLARAQDGAEPPLSY